jgi:hypothetical protein
MIPLLLIPQMILSGLLFNFDKLNNLISTRGKVPVVADLMASRWAYEALAVDQFANNSYEKDFYLYDKAEARFDFNSSFLVNELDKKRKFIFDNKAEKNDSIQHLIQKDLNIIRETLAKDRFKTGLEKELATPWTVAMLTPEFNTKLEAFLTAYKVNYQTYYNKTVEAREDAAFKKESQGNSLTALKNAYYNESLADLVKNVSVKDRIIEFKGELIQQINPVFVTPEPDHALDYRAHFFAPEKNLFGSMVSTFWFNILVIWLMTLALYVTLYFEWLRKFIDLFDKASQGFKIAAADDAKKK